MNGLMLNTYRRDQYAANVRDLAQKVWDLREAMGRALGGPPLATQGWLGYHYLTETHKLLVEASGLVQRGV